MTSPDHRQDADRPHDKVDPEHPREGNPFDQPDHFTGEDYDIRRERVEGWSEPSGQEDRIAAGGDPATPTQDDNRASFDPATGAVHEIKLPEDGGLPSA